MAKALCIYKKDSFEKNLHSKAPPSGLLRRASIDSTAPQASIPSARDAVKAIYPAYSINEAPMSIKVHIPGLIQTYYKHCSSNEWVQIRTILMMNKHLNHPISMLSKGLIMSIIVN